MADDSDSGDSGNSTIVILPDGAVYITETDSSGNTSVEGLEGSFDTGGFEVDIGTDYTNE